MELLNILQPQRGLVLKRVFGISHLFLSRRGGLRAQTSSAIFSIGDSMQGKDKGKGSAKGKDFGK